MRIERKFIRFMIYQFFKTATVTTCRILLGSYLYTRRFYGLDRVAFGDTFVKIVPRGARSVQEKLALPRGGMWLVGWLVIWAFILKL